MTMNDVIARLYDATGSGVNDNVVYSTAVRVIRLGLLGRVTIKLPCCVCSQDNCSYMSFVKYMHMRTSQYKHLPSRVIHK